MFNPRITVMEGKLWIESEWGCNTVAHPYEEGDEEKIPIKPGHEEAFWKIKAELKNRVPSSNAPEVSGDWVTQYEDDEAEVKVRGDACYDGRVRTDIYVKYKATGEHKHFSIDEYGSDFTDWHDWYIRNARKR